MSRIDRPRLVSTFVVLFAAIALVVSSPGVAAAEPAPSPGWKYTMVGFSNSSVRDMDVYTSSDGTDFQLLKKAAYRPPAGVVRDPSIFRHTNGLYYITYTTGDTSIGFASSPDLVNWTPMKNWPLPFCCAFLPGTGDGKGPLPLPGVNGSAGFRDGPSLSPFTTKAWAPEWFVDGNTVNIIVSMSTGGGFVPYLMTALNSSLTLWSFPVALDGIGADHIDTTIVKVGSTYHAFTKNETKKTIQHAVAPTLRGRYSYVTPGDWGTLVEGPAVTQLPNGTWRLYLDSYKAGDYVYSDSSDGMRTWTKPAKLTSVSGTVRHFGIMRERATAPAPAAPADAAPPAASEPSTSTEPSIPPEQPNA
ncbi:arabinofuranosidase [Gordonia sp. (in: high G+C Gram-positive bacteria)]|uniref:arabinofuranosidase n=1 Tax=Gordonia sp. (in: high G+C Gram-positive bacteria) TaxID=84139 RepID=UPI003C776696